MKKVLISGYYGFDNFGDEAILGILLDKLKDCQVTVLTADPRKTFDTYGIHTVYTFSLDHVLKEIAACDVLISGGGSLLQNATSSKSLWFYSSIIQFALLMKKEVVIFAQGIGPIKGWFSTMLVKGLLKKCKYISVRDENSLKLLQKWKIKNANLVCDPMYGLEVVQPERTSKIGIQLRRFDTLTDELFDKIVQQVKSRYYNREIELLSLQDEMDAGISQVFINKLKHVDPNIKVKLVTGLNNEQIIKRISEYDCLVAMRFHACLVALKYGVKTLAIAYDPKVETLAKDAGIPYLNMESKKNNYEQLFNDMENLSRWNLMEAAKNKKFSWEKTGIYEVKKEKDPRKRKRK
ncbi:MAG: polysaccharide pyruvyl transferase CsaB [Candidatus Gastranaerophilales bacterium]|nr:polysaccharide pyruvyl transferase CsaB [Candidatus Gastranaerophilales bacterium]